MIISSYMSSINGEIYRLGQHQNSKHLKLWPCSTANIGTAKCQHCGIPEKFDTQKSAKEDVRIVISDSILTVTISLINDFYSVYEIKFGGLNVKNVQKQNSKKRWSMNSDLRI